MIYSNHTFPFNMFRDYRSTVIVSFLEFLFVYHSVQPIRNLLWVVIIFAVAREYLIHIVFNPGFAILILPVLISFTEYSPTFATDNEVIQTN